MPAIAAGERVKVTLEFPDGRILEVPAYTVSVSMYHDTFGFNSGAIRTRIELEAIEPGVIRATDRSEYIEKAREVKTAVEWECLYCHKPNPRHATYCGQDTDGRVGCGAMRPVIYDL